MAGVRRCVSDRSRGVAGVRRCVSDRSGEGAVLALVEECCVEGDILHLKAPRCHRRIREKLQGHHISCKDRNR